MKEVWKSPFARGALLVLLTMAAHLPALPGQFIWDDDSWTTNIAKLLSNCSGLRQIWCDPTALQQYYPLTATCFWLNYQLWGFWTLPYHMVNVLLHALAALLFWRLLQRLQVSGAWLAGAIFALHPVMVESAAWITELKNVLSLVFYLGALLAYGRFSDFGKLENDPTTNTLSRRCGAYVLALVLFLAALLSKTTVFSLPAVILLVCWWKRGHIRLQRDVLPTLPFFAVSIGLCLVTAWLEREHVGAKGAEWAMSFPERCLIAGRAAWFYVGKLLWPVNLCFVYPRWHLDANSLWQWLYPITALGTLFTLWILRNRIGRGPVAAAFYFVGTLFPVLGFMNAYFMRFSFVCDHWVYLPSLGLIALVTALFMRVAERFNSRAALYGFVAVLLPVLGILTWRQSAIYISIETLWRDTLAKNPASWMAHYNLGLVLHRSGRMEEAEEHYEQALRFKPDCNEAQNNLAWLLATLGPTEGGDPIRALALARRACELTSNSDAATLDTLAVAYAATGRFNDAIATTQKAVELARATGQMELVQKMEDRLELYRGGHAYHPSVEMKHQSKP